jgi:CBS domain containing-hemolysin-like protein
MTAEISWIVGIILAALAASGLFSAAEMAIFSVHPHTLRILLEQDRARALRLEAILNAPRRFLAIILLGNVFVNAVVCFGLVVLWNRVHGEGARGHIWAPIITAMLLILVIGEWFPKMATRPRAARLALSFATGLHALEQWLRPVAVRAQRFSDRLAMRMVPSSMRPQAGLTEEEYRTVLDVSTQEGTLRPVERRLIERTLALADLRLRELMVPRGNMRCLNAETDLETMKTQARSMQHRRLPIFSGSLDSIVGVLNVKRLLVSLDVDVIDCIEPAAFVPETMTALDLLKNFLRGPQRLAIVVDEFGGVEGLITIEDLIEEVFGEIYDEYDETVPDWEKIEPGTYLVRGSARLAEVSARLRVKLKAEGVDTLGGWLADRLGALPNVGDRVNLRGCSFQVEKMNRMAVDAVLVRSERRKL